MSDPNQSETEPADLRGPGDPDAAPKDQAHPAAGTAGNIREEQMTQAAGTVPAAYVGPEDEQAGGKPEDAAAEGTWDDEV